MCWFVRRNSASSAARSFVSGHDVGGAQERGELDLGDGAVVEGGDEVADVEDADDLVERLAEDGVARVGRLEHGA